MNHLAALFFLFCASTASGFVPATSSISPASPSLALSMARRGKGLDIGDGGASTNRLNNPKSIGGTSDASNKSSSSNNSWIQTSIPSIDSLPQEQNMVKVIDTNVPKLIDKNTNPTGAVSIVNIDKQTYCFSSSCAGCKIPLPKAEILSPNDETNGVDPRLRCDFCGATYNLRTGVRLTKKDGSEGWKPLGFLFGNANGENNPLPVYALGERGGKVYINVP
jgi:nitrite reductase/ring-hydroxylating ferredoxin subunit